MRVLAVWMAVWVAGCDRPVASTGRAARPTPQHPMVVRCFHGGVDSGVSASFQSRIPPSLPPNAVVRTSGRFGDAGGPAAEVEWVFLGRRGDRDVYRVSLRYPVDAPGEAVRVAEVEFGGERVRAVEDGTHTVVLDPGRL